MMLGPKWRASYDRHGLSSQVRVLNYAYNCNGEMFECNVTSATICSNCGSEQTTKD
jgi:hypothetical protein